jgi:proteasome lid subunit RPN8/RPN11
MKNVARRARIRFRIDPAEHLAVRRVLRQVTPALQIIGVYHSHPQGPATPSARDVAEANYPEWLFVIIGRSSRSIGAFQIRGGSSVTVPIRWRSPAGRRSMR